MNGPNAVLVLEDGKSFRGRAIGATGDVLGEVVFNTSMTGYQEICTDPSYRGQIVVFTAPQIGNYGVCAADSQTPRRDWARLRGVVIRELSPVASNWRAESTFDQWLIDQQIPGISEVDTRALTRHLRDKGAMRGGIFAGSAATEQMVQQVLASPSMEGQDLASEVSTPEPYPMQPEAPQRKAVVLDFGVKDGILRCLRDRGFAVEVVPAGTSAEQIMARKPDGVVLSNGPGDPAAVSYGIETARQLVGQTPILGICLGYQILACAVGGRTYKLPFGHHGGNHPVKDLRTGQVWITAQNHGFAVDPDSLPEGDTELTHISLYDQTLEGFACKQRRVMAVQYHPEAGPGPSDAAPLFDRFVTLVEGDETSPATPSHADHEQ